MKKRYLAGALLVLSFASIFIGVTPLSPFDLFDLTEDQAHTLAVSRLPRLASILIAGMSMSVCGMIMQQLSRNKFVSPTTAGTMDSARLGILVALMIFTNASPLEKAAVSFGFALLGTFLFMKILERIKFKDSVFIPLVGLMFGNIIGSITTFFAYKNDIIQNMSSWLHGDFSMIISGQYELIYITLPVLSLLTHSQINSLLRGWGKTFPPISAFLIRRW